MKVSQIRSINAAFFALLMSVLRMTATSSSCFCSGAFLPIPTHPRRSSSSSCYAAQTTNAGGDPYRAQKLLFQGMEAFRQGNVNESIELFDQAETARSSITPYLWQRGLSYYYADKFVDASRQFQIDVKVNPLDVEEIVWDIASQYRELGPDSPEVQKMSLPRGQTDRRKIMASVYRLFRGEGTEHDLAVAGHTSGRPSDEFYSLFYLGLYCEARGETSKAAEYMRQAVRSDYANAAGRGDYMTSCARVHCQLRGWI